MPKYICSSDGFTNPASKKIFSKFVDSGLLTFLYRFKISDYTYSKRVVKQTSTKTFPLNGLLLLRLPSKFSGLHMTLQIAYNIEVHVSLRKLSLAISRFFSIFIELFFIMYDISSFTKTKYMIML